jgi:hypothetical protein
VYKAIFEGSGIAAKAGMTGDEILNNLIAETRAEEEAIRARRNGPKEDTGEKQLELL